MKKRVLAIFLSALIGTQGAVSAVGFEQEDTEEFYYEEIDILENDLLIDTPEYISENEAVFDDEIVYNDGTDDELFIQEDGSLTETDPFVNDDLDAISYDEFGELSADEVSPEDSEVLEEVIQEDIEFEETAENGPVLQEEVQEPFVVQVTEQAGGTNPSGKCGENLNWEVKDGILTIWGTGDMDDYGTTPWYYYGTFTKIVIEPGVTSIGDKAFYKCGRVAEISIPDTVTRIGERAFENCSKLESIGEPKGLTYIGDYAFQLCSNLRNVKLPDGVTSIADGLFSSCYNLESISLGNHIISIGESAFYACKKLSHVDIPESVKSIGKTAFSICTSLEDVFVPADVENIGDRAFSDCESLQAISVADENPYYYSNEGALYNSQNGELVCFPAGKGGDYAIVSGTTGIHDYALYHCTGLTSVTIPDSVTRIGGYAFQYCSGLKSVTIGNKVGRIGTCAFYNCTGLATVRIGSGVYKIEQGAFYGCSGLKDVYYAGTKEEWKDFSLAGTYNDPLMNAVIHYSFGIESDTWSFRNPVSIINVGIFSMFFPPAVAIVLKAGYDGTTGQCGGMATSSSCAYMGYPAAPFWGNHSSLYDVERTDYCEEVGSSAIDYIGYAQVFELTPTATKKKISRLGKMDKIRDAVYDCQNNNGEPVEIIIRGSAGVHALLGYRIESETEQETRIAVYDCNVPGQEDCYLIMKGSYGNYTGWSYSKEGSGNWNSEMLFSFISYLMPTEDFPDNYKSRYAKTYTLLKFGKDITGIIWENSLNLLSWSMDSLADSRNNDYFIPIIIPTGTQTQNNNYFWVMNAAPLSFSGLSGTGEIALAEGKLGIMVNPAAGSDLRLDVKNGSVEFSKTENKEVHIQYELSSDYENSDIIKIDGISDGNTKTVKDTEGNVIFSGLKTLTVSLSTAFENSDGNTIITNHDSKSLTGLDSGKKYKVYVDSRGTKKKPEIFEDKDENGTFETPITSRPTIKLNKTVVSLFTGKSEKITVSGMLQGDKVSSWKSSDPTIAAVDSSGSIIAKNPGSTTVTVTLLSGLSADIKVTVLKPTIKVMPTSLTLDVGKNQKITVSNMVTGDRITSWNSADTTVATVNSSGSITGRKAGTTTVTVTLLSGLSTTVKVTVKEPLKQPRLIAAYNGAKGIGVKFIKVAGAEEYMIYQKLKGVWNQIATVKANSSALQVSGDTLMYTDTSVAKSYGTGFIYSVAAKKGNTATTYNTTGVAIYRLNPPSISTATNSTAGIATVTWRSVFGKTETNGNYDLQMAEYNNGKAGAFNSITRLPGYKYNVLTARVSGLKKGKTYIFRIRCSKTNKDRGTFYSEYSPWKTLKISK